MSRLWTRKRRKRTAPRPDVLGSCRCHPCGDADDLLTYSLTLRPCLFDQRNESELARAGGYEKLGIAQPRRNAIEGPSQTQPGCEEAPVAPLSLSGRGAYCAVMTR